MCVTRALWWLAIHKPVGRMGVQQGNGTVVQRSVHQLPQTAALALLQGKQHANDSVHARHHIHHRQAHAQRITARLTIDAHDAAHGLNSCVIARPCAQRPIGAKAADTAPDQSWKAHLHLLPAYAPLLQRANLEILHHHIGLSHQLQHSGLAFRLAEVQKLRTFVAVEPAVVRSNTVLKRRPPGTGVIALRGLYLQHISTMVAQNLTAQRPPQNARKIQHLQALQSTCGRACRCGTSCWRGCCHTSVAHQKFSISGASVQHGT